MKIKLRLRSWLAMTGFYAVILLKASSLPQLELKFVLSYGLDRVRRKSLVLYIVTFGLE